MDNKTPNRKSTENPGMLNENPESPLIREITDSEKKVLGLALIILLALAIFSIFLSQNWGTEIKQNVNCSSFSVESCPVDNPDISPSCAVCPSCEECSSISCQTEDYCKSIGINKSWWQGIRQRIQQQSG